MKVKGKDNNSSQDAVKIQQQQSDAVANRKNIQAQVGQQIVAGLQTTDKVDVSSLAQAINQQLDPNGEAEAARRKKVENLKQLVQSGQYNPPSQDVARAVGEDIVFEILSSGGQ